jgi:signal transduction histidine kinase
MKQSGARSGNSGNDKESRKVENGKGGCISMSPVDIYQPINNLGIYFVVIAIMEALAVYLFQFSKIPGAKLLVYCQVAKAVWIIGRVLIAVSPALPVKLLWQKIPEMMAILLIYFWFIFILKMSQPKEKFFGVLQHLVSGIVVCLLLVIGFDEWLGWYKGLSSFDGQNLTIAFGPAGVVTIVFDYLLNLLCFALSGLWILRSNGLRRQQAIALSIIPVFSLLGNFIGYLPPFSGFLPQLTGFLCSGVYTTWAFYRWRVYSILPLARDAVADNMIDGLLVVDEKGYIVDLNPAAQIIFSGFLVTVGGKFKEAVTAWPVLAGIEADSGIKTLEGERDLGTERRFYQIRTLLLKTPQGNLLGKTIIFKDITRQKRDQAKMMEQQKALTILTERERLGRELHDGRGQIWNYLNFELQIVRSLLDRGQLDGVSKQVDRLVGIVKELNVDARESIVGLKRTADSGNDFLTNLQEYLAWYEKSNGIATRLILPVEPVSDLFGHIVEVQLLRIIQEALTNIRKHAKARQVKVVIQKFDQEVNVRIEDDGCGFDRAAIPGEQKSFGLQIMAERAEEAGGELRIESQPGAGTTVLIQFPREKTENEEENDANIVSG